jgi:integrase
MTIITDRDFMELELHLSDHPHQNALKTLSQKRTDSKALLRIFMRAIRLTGMRPVEVFNCRLMVGNVDREYSEEEVRNAYDRPYRTALSRTLTAIDDIDPRPWGSMAAMVRHTCDMTGIPPILMIEAAKTTNANPDLLRPFRAQVLKNIEDDDLEVLSLAAHLHHFRIDKKRRSNLITTMTRNLSAVADKALPRRNDTLNLYSFRHDFATRARLRLQVWEVAALMGHTAKASTYAYGKRNTRKKSGSSSAGGWMPLQDAEFAEDIREKWGAAPEEAPQVDVRQALTDAMYVENSIKDNLPER